MSDQTAQIHALDVRPILAAGGEPLGDILAALASVGSHNVLLITAPFRPRPLIALLTEKGCGVAVHALPDGSHAVAVVKDAPVVAEDLTDLPPPEPLEAVLSADLTGQSAAAFWLPRYPSLLVPLLAKRPLSWAISVVEDGAALLLLRPQTDTAAAKAPVDAQAAEDNSAGPRP
ncbi:MAG: DUF2249 domain-containing protein [Myxococcales bacterium]|nr:DUF2249 domain-containing protein [Myxococcales bacterium]